LTWAATEFTIAAMRRLPLAIVLFVVPPLLAQTPGSTAFVVYEKGHRIGTLETDVARTQDGWRIRGSMETKGAVPVRIANLDLRYDRNWFGRWMTMEMKAPDDVIVHVAVSRSTAQVDVVRAGEARFRSTSVSRNTILLPERAYGAYEAVAARLATDAARGDLPIYVPPTGETRAVIESVAIERIQTAKGVLSAQHYVLTEVRPRPTRVELWADRGRLLRLDFPAAQISIVRADVGP
jgi:hypothetical protein